MFQPYLESLEGAARRIAQDPSFGSSWQCRTGLWPEPAMPQAAVLKLHRAHWSQAPADSLSAASEIFFSVWVDEEAVKKGGLHYNLHALKLRGMAGYNLESRKFASAFRAVFGPRSTGWPGVKMAYGPQTLFQGFVKCPPARVEAAALSLAKKFIPLGSIVDDLLARAAVKRPAHAAVRPRTIGV